MKTSRNDGRVRQNERVRHLTRLAIACTSALVVASVHAATESLYDAQSGSLPEAQGWTYFTLPPVADAFATYAKLDTTSSDLVRGGWTRVASPILARAGGIQLDFQLRVVAESHSSMNRAGFSVILLDHDKRGIELGFWKDHVWAQSDVPLFTHAEDKTFDTTVGIAAYSLVMVGDTYTLSADGAPLLSGPVRDYTAFSGNFDVYETPDFLFFGDDTTSGSASILLQSVHLTRGVTPKGPPPLLAAGRVGSAVQLRWAAVAGGPDWTLESASDPVNGPWTVDAAPRGTEPGTGGESMLAQPDVSAANRFYRLR